MTPEDIYLNAFLKLIRYAEHKQDDDGVYYIQYGGGTFTDDSKHPNKAVKRWGKTSTAAGAYQILAPTWNEAKEKHIVNDFKPASQDAIAIWKLKTRRAYDHVIKGELEKAIARLRNEWTSLPGATQSSMSMEDAKKRFKSYVEALGGKWDDPVK